jgi:beta-galactosidase
MTPKLRMIVCVAAAWAAARAPAAPSSLSLAGEWRFALDPGAVQHGRSEGLTAPLPPGDGVAQEWFKRDLPDHIRLPGILQAQGYGDEISPATPWVLTLGDAWWNLQPAALREHFSQPGHVEVPFLAQPPRHYLGAAWYQRDVDIPAGWQGRRVVLFLEHPHWESTVWWDDQPHAPDHSLSAPHIVDLGLVAPGRHRLTIRVDNRRIIADPANNGHGDDAHSVSDALGAAWNGIVGRIELRATTPVWIEDAQAYPSVAQHSVTIKVKIGNATGQAGSGSLSAGGQAQPIAWTADGGSAEIQVPLPADTPAWDEFHPVLQHLTVALQGGGADAAVTVVFGLREISYRDKDMLLNGQVINLRLTHFGGDFPLTGYPPTDVASWKKLIAVCKAYGLNGMRFHSWCPPEAAFTAADEMGFYLQPECGMWSPFNPGSAYMRFLEEETPRILRAFGNHPSFILLSPSNEPSGHYQQVTPHWAAAWYARDNRHLYSAGTGWGDRSQVEGGPQYASLVRYNSANLRNTGGWFGSDFRAALATAHIPVLAHEVGQWCAYPDFDVIKEFTGYLRPGNYDIFKYLAEQQGVLPLDHAFAYASGRFQVACYKEEIEANLRTPGLSGFQLLDLHDYLGQGTALIGVVDAFWQPKSYVTAGDFRRFSGPTVPLARLERRVFTTAESLTADTEIYHFAAGPIRHAKPYWKIVDRRGHTAAEGRWPEREIAIGKNIPLGKIAVDLSAFAAPEAYRLVVGLRDTPVENDWNFWVYPAPGNQTAPANVFVTHDWSDAAAHLAEGDKVLFLPGAADLDPARCPPMKNVPVFWNIQMTVRPPRNPTARFDAMLGLLCDPQHPALAEFPTEVNCDWQWTPIINNVRSINLDGAPRALHPIVSAIDDWNRDWRLGVIFECAVGAGQLLVSAINLEDPQAGPGTQQLRRSLLDYMAAKQFHPRVALTPEEIGRLWRRGTPAIAPGKRAFDPDLDDSSSPARPRPAP